MWSWWTSRSASPRTHPSDGPVRRCLAAWIDRGVHITSYGAAGRQGIVSRLDVGTSGLMLVCKSDLAYVEMRRQFAEHEVVKTYHALVQGNLKEDKATIEAPIGRAKVSDFRFCVTPAGKEAITHWDVMERFGEATLVSVNLETGRTHQIACISHLSGIRWRGRHVRRESAAERGAWP